MIFVVVVILFLLLLLLLLSLLLLYLPSVDETAGRGVRTSTTLTVVTAESLDGKHGRASECDAMKSGLWWRMMRHDDVLKSDDWDDDPELTGY